MIKRYISQYKYLVHPLKLEKLRGNTTLAFFLGAGASVECGMPLVWQFTSIFSENILKRIDTKLFDFSGDIEIRDRFISIISNGNLHYEDMLSELEAWKLSENGGQSQIVDGLIKQSTECIQLLLLELQENCLLKMRLKFDSYFGLKSIVQKFGHLDVYSLNHDSVIEELCSFYDIPLKDGFHADREHNYSRLGNFRIATLNELRNHELDFFERHEGGVNLIKLHGSFDIFAIEDKGKYLKSVGGKQYGSQVGAIINPANKNI